MRLRPIIAPFWRIFGVIMLVYLGLLFVVVVSAVLCSALLTATLFGAMYGVHTLNRLGKIHLPHTEYENFDFDNMTKPAVSEFLVRLAVVVFPATVLLPVLIAICFPWDGAQGFRRHYAVLSVLLLILEAAAIAISFWKILKIDWMRIAIFTTVSFFAYMLLYWLFIYDKLYG